MRGNSLFFLPTIYARQTRLIPNLLRHHVAARQTKPRDPPPPPSPYVCLEVDAPLSLLAVKFYRPLEPNLPWWFLSLHAFRLHRRTRRGWMTRRDWRGMAKKPESTRALPLLHHHQAKPLVGLGGSFFSPRSTAAAAAGGVSKQVTGGGRSV